MGAEGKIRLGEQCVDVRESESGDDIVGACAAGLVKLAVLLSLRMQEIRAPTGERRARILVMAMTTSLVSSTG